MTAWQQPLLCKTRINKQSFILFMKLLCSKQRRKYGGYVVTARFDPEVYSSMLGLISAAGYADVSSFVRETIHKRCKDIAQDMSGLMTDRLA